MEVLQDARRGRARARPHDRAARAWRDICRSSARKRQRSNRKTSSPSRLTPLTDRGSLVAPSPRARGQGGSRASRPAPPEPPSLLSTLTTDAPVAAALRTSALIGAGMEECGLDLLPTPPTRADRQHATALRLLPGGVRQDDPAHRQLLLIEHLPPPAAISESLASRTRATSFGSRSRNSTIEI
jgi:hypothetical protein